MKNIFRVRSVAADVRRRSFVRLVTSAATFSWCVVLLTGCVTSQHIVTGPTRPAIAPASVRIYRSMPASAQEIGIVTAEADGRSQAAMNLALKEIAKQAAALGANGFTVIGSGNRTETQGGIGTFVPVGGFGMVFSDDTKTHKTIVKARAFYLARTNP